MEKNNIKEDIVELLEIIVEQSEIISHHIDRIPQIEIDIILSNVRKLYEKYRKLEKLNKTSPNEFPSKPIIEEEPKQEIIAKPIAAVETPKVEEKIIEEPKKEINVEVKEEVKIEKPVVLQKTKTIAELFAEENKIEETKNVVEEDSHQKKIKIKKTEDVDLFSTHSTVADKFKDDKISLNEKLSASQTDKSIAAKLQKNPIKDLKAAIGINEKFKFINELFEGNLQKYTDGITKLNEFSNLDEAITFLIFLKKEFSWGNDNAAYLELTELISRRYQN